MKSVTIPALLLAACNGQPSAPPARDSEVPATKSPAQPAALQPKAFSFDEENDLIEFHFGWSAEAAAVPLLATKFRSDMEKAKSELLAGATEDKAMREKEGFDFHGYMSSTVYETAGQSQRLLSLRVDVGSYTGGAHGNAGTGSLLWDRAASREVQAEELFAEASNMKRLLTQRWCDALNKAREEKRGEPVGGGGMFDECPDLGEIAIIPTDKDRNGRFELLTLVASPYVAGPWVEGEYEIELAVTSDLIAALKTDYRASFEVPQAQ